MDEKTRETFEIRAKILKAIAHPTRLFIVDQLSDKKYCVADLTKMIGADMSTVSKHLFVLKSVGIVADEKSGNQVYYRLAMPCILGFFECIETILKTNALKQLSLTEKE